MKRGKKICETLKGIRRDIAIANEIEYNPTECHHEGDCAGTCPKCESETRWLERQLRARQALGKTVAIAGLSMALGAMSSCNFSKQYKQDRILGHIPDSSYCSPVDTSKQIPEGDVDMRALPDDSLSCPAKGKNAQSIKGNDEEVDGYLENPDNRVEPLSNGNNNVAPKGNDDEEEQVMGEVAVDENGNIGEL